MYAKFSYKKIICEVIQIHVFTKKMKKYSKGLLILVYNAFYRYKNIFC